MAAEGLTLLGRCFFDFKGGGHSGDIELMRRLDQDAIEPGGPGLRGWPTCVTARCAREVAGETLADRRRRPGGHGVSGLAGDLEPAQWPRLTATMVPESGMTGLTAERGGFAPPRQRLPRLAVLGIPVLILGSYC